MNYWVILGALVVVALILIVIIIVALMKGRQQGSEEEYPEDYDDEYEEEPGREEMSRRGRGEQGPVEAEPAGESGRRRPEEEEAVLPAFREKSSKKRQWKLLLENVDSWQKHSYVFYDNVGIGRSRSNSVFEKYLSVPDDPRVSKVHCAIIQNEDKLYLKDLGARNGTYLNGKRISQPVLIQRDDIIGLGETRIEIKSIMKEKDERIAEE